VLVAGSNVAAVSNVDARSSTDGSYKAGEYVGGMDTGDAGAAAALDRGAGSTGAAGGSFFTGGELFGLEGGGGEMFVTGRAGSTT
jgi:hypothetical protein